MTFRYRKTSNEHPLLWILLFLTRGRKDEDERQQDHVSEYHVISLFASVSCNPCNQHQPCESLELTGHSSTSQQIYIDALTDANLHQHGHGSLYLDCHWYFDWCSSCYTFNHGILGQESVQCQWQGITPSNLQASLVCLMSIDRPPDRCFRRHGQERREAISSERRKPHYRLTKCREAGGSFKRDQGHYFIQSQR